MRKKTIVTRARLVKGPRWYIDFTRYDPEKGVETRHRQDFELNEIADEHIREEVAVRLVRHIDLFAVPKNAGARPISAGADVVTVCQAVETALSIKKRLPRENSRRGYDTVARALLSWADRAGYGILPVGEFGRKHCRAFFDHLTKKKALRGRTLNNYRERLHGLWQEMVKDEMIHENPWAKIQPVRNEEKLRRPFTQDERRTVAKEIEATDYWLFRGVLLQFFCYVRPVELCRLRFRDFDLGRGLVTVREDAAKGWRKVVKTIPASVLPYFVDGRFDKQPGNYYMFGRVGEGARAKMEPSPLQIDESRPYKRHQRILKRLNAAGALPGGIAGLTWYSWKDTGISLHTRKTSPVATKDQAGHRDLSITSVYYHVEETNSEYRTLENDLLT